MDRQSDSARIVSEINNCQEEMNVVLRQYAQRLYHLKLTLARVCGHERTTREWAWTKCLDCGAVELTAILVSHQQAVNRGKAAEITAW